MPKNDSLEFLHQNPYLRIKRPQKIKIPCLPAQYIEVEQKHDLKISFNEENVMYTGPLRNYLF